MNILGLISQLIGIKTLRLTITIKKNTAATWDRRMLKKHQTEGKVF